jgi:hypothetical protein
MRVRTVGNLLVAAGAAVGVVAVAAIATGYQIRLTPEMIQLLTYKALGAAAVGLIVVGTWIGRGGNQTDHVPSESGERELTDSSEPPAADLSGAAPPEIRLRPGERQSSER